MPTPAPWSTPENTEFTTILIVLLSWVPGQARLQSMSDVLCEDLFIILVNIRDHLCFLKLHSAFYESFIHCRFSHIVPFLPNDQSLSGLSLIPSIPPQNLLCSLNISPLHTSQSSHELVWYWSISNKSSYSRKTHFTVAARTPMLIRGDRILQNFC